MLQTFTGNTRRPRQVNLSGRSSNPFAATNVGGPQGAIDIAREDRAKRQQERERTQASTRVQRVWRGHASRRKTFDIWRSIWDEHEKEVSGEGSYPSAEASLSQLQRLNLFFSPKTQESDVKRLNWYGHRQANTASTVVCEGAEWEAAYWTLCTACLRALRVEAERGQTDEERETLNILTFAITRSRRMYSEEAKLYYDTLSLLLERPSEALQQAILAPLPNAEAYAGLLAFFTRPLPPDILEALRQDGHGDWLARALSRKQRNRWRATTPARDRLWTLGNIISLCGVESTNAISDIAYLLGSLAGEVQFEGTPKRMPNVEFDRTELATAIGILPLNEWLAVQLGVITNQDTIRDMLPRNAVPSYLRTCASMALTLLRCFPRKADDIRMWLYLGPKNADDVPATRHFWSVMKQTDVFTSMSQDSRAVIRMLSARSTLEHQDDWTVIMIFLELYTFLVKVMDDEEFMGRASRGNQSAIPVDDTALLVTFLKNLSFTLYFNTSEIIGNTLAAIRSSTQTNSADVDNTTTYLIAGLPGLDIDYLKGIATGLLRAIYERDSRRHFLPADHWLMTSRFDMSAFIPAVVQEEESRHEIEAQRAAQGEDADGDKSEDNEEEQSPSSARHARTSSYARNERKQQELSRKRYLEAVTPRLEILQNMPFFIPFNTRVEIFRQFILLDQFKRRNGRVDQDAWRAQMMFNLEDPERHALSRRHANVKRKSEFEDAFKQFGELGEDFKEPIQITFWDEHGLQEAGIDGGGVTKEFLTSVIDQALNGWADATVPKFFKENDQHLLCPNPTLLADIVATAAAHDNEIVNAATRDCLRATVKQFEFLGLIIGKCLYEGILIDVAFAGFFLKKWAVFGGHGKARGENGYRANINDLRDLDEALYRGLLEVKNAPDASLFDLNFTVDDIVGSKGSKTVKTTELIANGANVTVTNQNRLIYIAQMARQRLQTQSAQVTNAFLRGLTSIIEPSWLSMFNQSELQTLIGGSSSGVDVQDLRRNTQYGGTYVIGDDGEEHPSVKLFWSIMQALPDSDRQKVLKFVTSTPRGPLLGFGHLNPRFSIRDSGSDENRFPTTSTCVNLLKLPMYKSEATMRKKLLDAVNSGAGFDLS